MKPFAPAAAPSPRPPAAPSRASRLTAGLKPTALNLTIAAALIALCAAPASAQRFPRELQDIRMYGQGETIEFVFSQPYQGTPIETHKPGMFSLNFSVTGSAKPVRSLRPVDQSIYKEIRVVQNQYSTTVSFHLKDAKQSLKNKLAFSTQDNLLTVRVDAPSTRGGSPVAGSRDQDLLSELGQLLLGTAGASVVPGTAGASVAAGKAGTSGIAASTVGAATGTADAASPVTFGELTGGNFFTALITMVIALAVIIAALYGLLFLYNRYVATRLRRFTSSPSIRQVASFHIGPRQRVVVLDINGEIVACGVTPNQISYITHLGGTGARAGGAKASETAAAAGATFTPPDGLEAAPAAADARETPTDPVHQFAEVLKQKVRSLKRIN